MTEDNMIPLEDAPMAALAAYADMLGIEYKSGTNSTQLRAKIQRVEPNTTKIPAVAEPPPVQKVEGENPEERPAAVSRPATKKLLHQIEDPRVELTIHKTTDKRRPKDVTVNVNGIVTRIQRGVKVNVPYRVYEALNNAIEKQAVETDEVNPITGDPIMGWQDEHSYPFTVYKMPSDEEITAWHEATDEGFQNNQAKAAVAA